MKENLIQEREEKIRKFWKKEKIYKFDPNSDKEIFSVDTPPPTISGKLHMGHALGDSQQDFFVRYKRMRGFNVLNPFGTDNNGLPTLKLIEREKGVDSKKMKREDFIELCNQTIKKEFIPLFLEDSKKLGISADWDLFYSTIDKRSRKISKKSFIELFKQGREYRVEAPMMICPRCQTAIAQVEMEDAELDSQLCYIKVKVETGDELVFATTRPELLPACIGISVHPDDKRYKHLIGKKIKLPLINREVVLSADSETDPEYGSGVVYYCSYGGVECIDWLTRHPDVKPIHVMGVDGVYNTKAGKYQGMNSREARKEILKDLKKAGALVKTENLKHVVNVHERCGTEVEYVATKQWFIKYLDMKKKLLEWGSEIKWHPEYMKTRYDNWVKGLRWDWCISRQIPFGIAFPVWYCEKCGKVILADEKQLPVDPTETKPPVRKCPDCGSYKFIPEKDVMNTWATSALTPTIVKDLLKGTKAYEKIKNKPMNIRRNGQDIISFWDFNTIVKSQLHYQINPWKELYINGWILGRDGHKMSKSKSNSISPQEIIEKYGADVLRYLSASVKPGDAVPFSDKELIAGKKFINKLTNASKFVFMNLKDYKNTKPKKLEELDKLFLEKLSLLVKKVTNFFESYKLSRAKAETEKFFLGMFCDNYLEIIKNRIYNSKGNKKISAQYTLYNSLLTMLKLMAPFIPFITEEIYQTHFKKFEKANQKISMFPDDTWEKNKSIHLSKWPEEFKIKIKDKEIFDLMIKIISKVRQKKSDAKKSMNSEIILTLEEKNLKNLKDVLDDFKAVTNSVEIKSGKLGVEFI